MPLHFIAGTTLAGGRRVTPSKDRGELHDGLFDVLYPDHVRAASSTFWTPIAVARCAVRRLEELGVRRVLDVGAGPGKFCIAAGAVARHVSFTGIEQRTELVELATALATRLRLPNVRFRVGNATDCDWAEFEALYFFNPFAENLFDDEEAFDDRTERSSERYMAEVDHVEQRLLEAPMGQVVLTYHGFGGRIPSCFELLREERCGTNWLRVWQKRRLAQRGSTGWLELYEGGVQRTRFFEPRGGASSS
jgi:SAM-dependent methyltransferase